MGPHYEYNFDYSIAEPALEGVAGFMMVFVIIFYLLTLALSVLAYVFQSVGMYAIAKRRGIYHPWLAWIPVGNMWLLGSISDQYQYVAKGRVCNRRKVLLGLMIATCAIMIPMYAAYFGFIFGIVDGGSVFVGAAFAIMMISAVALIVISIIGIIYQYIATYDLYASCDPDNAVLYLVLSIFFSVAMPILFFVCRNKDKGMPPKRQAQPVQPAFQPTWQPVQPTPVMQEATVVLESQPQEEQTEE